ncbi:c-type cytochrome domain-containing protein [Prosthecobacter sp.]|jgi:WD40 repeat protein|uniref:c-type cytochrome domain-containing protein n=1 Tax=Prosthecobacter sp. TaxID=1965333 RepID=UPI0037CC4E39
MKPHSLLVLLFTTTASLAADLDYYRDVYPFLKANCISCHNKTTTKADLNMETPELMIKGGESGPSIIPGNGAESLIVTASLHTKDMEMPPPNNKSGAVNLIPEQIATLKAWIDQGAKGSVMVERAVVLQAFSASIDPIYSVAMTKDGRYVACGRSNHIYVYDMATRQFVAQISDLAEKNGAAHRALVQSLSFSPDGTRLASGSFREVKIWKLAESKPAAGTAKTSSAPASAELIKKIATAGKVIVLSSAMSADGKQVVTGCGDGSVRVWDVATAKPVIELRGSVAEAKKMAELDWVIAAQTLEQAFQKNEIARIEAQDKALDILLGKAKEAIVAMNKVLPEKQKAVSPTTEAKTTAKKAVDDVTAKIKAASGGKPDAALDRELKAAQEKFITANMTEVSALAAVSAAQSNVKDAEDDVKRITDSKAANAKAVATANAAIAAAKTVQDKATADLAAAKLALTKTTAKPIAVSFSADALRVASMFDDGSLRVWGTATGTPIEESAGSAAAITTITSSPDGSFVASKSVTQSVGTSKQWALERKIDQKGLFADRVNAVRFSPDGKTLATGGGELSRSGDIIFFDVATGKATKTWKEKHADTVLCLDYSPDGKRLASGGADKIARVTDIATGKQLNLFEGHTHHVMGVAFRNDGRVLATAGAEGTVVTWDMIIGERKRKIEGWTKEVTSLQFIGATNQIVTSAGDNRIRIVTDDGTEVRAMANLPDFMQAAVSAPNGSAIIGGGEDSILRVWDGAGKEMVAFGAK